MANKKWEYEDFNHEDFTYDDFQEPEDFKYDDFSYDKYKESDKVTQAGIDLNAHNAKKPGAYQSQWQSQLNGLMDQIMNRDKFSYDMNGDALYQQYKDKYIQQGKMAMADTMGQAAAMTGGYGNSYAQSVGQQAYQGQLANLNDIVPGLYSMALDQYNREGQELYNQYGLVADRDNTDYGRYRDSVGDWQSERDYLAGRYDSERGFDYSKYVDDRNFAYSQYATDKNLSYDDYRNAIEDEQWQQQMDYAKEQDKLAQENWEKQFGLSERELAMQEEAWEIEKSEAGYSDYTGTPYKGKTASGAAYDNGSLDTESIKKIQTALGVTPDGYWGDVSSKAAGGLSPEEAYKKFVGGNAPGSPTPEVPQKIIDSVQNYTTEQGQADYLANQVNAGNITEDTAMEILGQYGVVDLTNRNWEMVDDGGFNFLWGVDNDAKVRDEYANEYTLKELKKELKKTMTSSDAKKYIKELQERLGI